MRAKPLSLFSSDLTDEEFEANAPSDPDYFGMLVGAYIGPEGEATSDLFEFIVCSPRFLATKVADSGYLLARFYLSLSRFAYNELWQIISRLCSTTEGPDWKTVVARLARYGRWEFEDYQEEPAPAQQER